MKAETPLTKEYLDKKFDLIDKRFDRIEKTFVTKDHFDETLSNFVTKDHFDKTLSNFVTKEHFDKSLTTFVTKDLFTKEIRNLRGSLHESLVTTLDNMKEYHREETERYIGALNEDTKEKGKGTKENMDILNEKWDNHEHRILKLEDILV